MSKGMRMGQLSILSYMFIIQKYKKLMSSLQPTCIFSTYDSSTLFSLSLHYALKK